jgi:hypothetical protein
MSILSPAMTKEADAIQNMDPATALKYLRDHGIDQSLAIGVLKSAQVKQAAKLQQAIQMQGQPGTTLQQNDQQYQQMLMQEAIQQQAANQARQGGITNLPVSPNMFTAKGMKAGGIVAFSEGGYHGPYDDDDDNRSPKKPDPDAEEGPQFIKEPTFSSLFNSPSINTQRSPNPWLSETPDNPSVAAAKPDAAPASAAKDNGTIPPIPPGGGFPTGYNAALSLKGMGAVGIPKELKDLYTEQQEQLRGMQPRSTEDHFNELSAIAQKNGIGAAADAHLKELEARKGTYEQMAKYGKWSALADAGFAMANAATQNPHGGFLGALAVGGAQGGKEFLSSVKDHRQAMNQLQDAQYAVQQSKENLVNDRTKESVAMHENDVTRYDRAFAQTTDTGVRVMGHVMDNQNSALFRYASIRAAAASRASYNPQSDLLNIAKEYGVNSLQYKNALGAYTEAQAATAQAQNAGLSVEQKREKMHQEMYLRDPVYKRDVIAYQNETDPIKMQQRKTGLMRTLDAASGNIFDLDGFSVKPSPPKG